jgi:hypothetical protein
MSGGAPPLHARLQPGRADASQAGHGGDGAHLSASAVIPISREVLADAEHAVAVEVGDLSEEECERAQRAAESLARRQRDKEKIDSLSRAGFTGPEYEIFAGELAAYAYPIVLSWLRRGLIWGHCADRGRPLNPTDTEREKIEGTFDERLELALETVAEALRFFTERALRSGRWTSGGGAALTTYFIGACLLAFPNVFRRWRRAEQRWRQGMTAATLDCPEGRTLADLPGSDPADVVAARSAALAELSHMPEMTRQAAALVADGMSFSETAAFLGTTSRAVEGRLYRYRQKRTT